MPEESKEETLQPQPKPGQQQSPLVFISHDSRDAKIAEAFSTLVHRVTAGMLKSFRSSDKSGTEGIEFGDEWYKRVMSNLDSASDVVCLFTERSLERPWILYEAGVAKAKLERPVLGIALGVPLSRVGRGPFYQFQNSDDGEESLSKLVLQLSRRIPNIEPDQKVVETQVREFKESIEELLPKPQEDGDSEQESPSEASTAKLLEELKYIVRQLPSRVEAQLGNQEVTQRNRRRRELYPVLLKQIIHGFSHELEPRILVLIIASFFRDNLPWLYELAREVYEASDTQDPVRQEQAVYAFWHVWRKTMQGGVAEMLVDESDEMRMLLMESTETMESVLTGMLRSPKEAIDKNRADKPGPTYIPRRDGGGP